MKPFVFSADAHLAEPSDLYLKAMPAHLKEWALWTDVDGDSIVIKMGDKQLLKVFRNIHDHKTGELGCEDVRRLGGRNLDMRLKDMERDGIDAELCYPGVGLTAGLITNAEALKETSRIYNDWAWSYLDGLHDKLIAAAMIPHIDIDDAVAELNRVIAMGYRTVMLPSVLPPESPQYNDPAWDRVFSICAEHEIPICIHTSSGFKNIRPMRGPGAAVYNYATLMNDAVNVITLLTAGGVLDRNPKAKILLSEYGAGWLLALGERLDEAYIGHAPMVQPKLNRMPSQIVREQVVLCMQNDLGTLKSLREQGIETVVFATDYPHSEGTFPYSMDLVEKILDEAVFLDLSREEREAVLGGTACKLFKIDPEKARNAALPVAA